MHFLGPLLTFCCLQAQCTRVVPPTLAAAFAHFSRFCGIVMMLTAIYGSADEHWYAAGEDGKALK